MTLRRWALALVAGAAVVLAACSSSPSTPKHTTTTTRAASSTSTTSSSTTTTSAPAHDHDRPPARPPCTRITASPGQGQGAAGTITGFVTVTNTGTSHRARSTATRRWRSSPGAGRRITVTMVNGLSVTISTPANAPPSSFSVAPSATAQFAYQFSDVPVGAETSCPTSESASVTMPGSTTRLAVLPAGDRARAATGRSGSRRSTPAPDAGQPVGGAQDQRRVDQNAAPHRGVEHAVEGDGQAVEPDLLVHHLLAVLRAGTPRPCRSRARAAPRWGSPPCRCPSRATPRTMNG